MLKLAYIGIGLALVGTLAMFAQAAYEPPLGREAPPQSEVREHVYIAPEALSVDDNKALHDQVSLCNLVNALWLEEPQIEEIIAVLKPEMAGIDDMRDELNGHGASGDYGDAMAELLSTLKKGGEADDSLRDRVNSYSAPTNRTKLNLKQAKRDIAEDIMPILSENQLIILGEYTPCLFNANDPLHPEKVGQASSASRVIERLTKIRENPERRDSDRVQNGLRRMAEHSKMDTPFDINVEDEIARLNALVDKAMALSDQEFNLQVDGIAKEIACYGDAKKEMIADHYNLPTGKRDHRVDKIANMLVIPGAVDILAAELKSRSE